MRGPGTRCARRRDETLRGGIVTVSGDNGSFVDVAPWHWQALDAVAAAQTWTAIAVFVTFLVTRYDLGDVVPRCWWTHGALVEELLGAQGDLGSFRIMQRQPAWRGRPQGAQLRRFLGTRSGRKIHYGHVLAGALDLTQVPCPLAGVLAHV